MQKRSDWTNLTCTKCYWTLLTISGSYLVWKTSTWVCQFHKVASEEFVWRRFLTLLSHSNNKPKHIWSCCFQSAESLSESHKYRLLTARNAENDLFRTSNTKFRTGDLLILTLHFFFKTLRLKKQRLFPSPAKSSESYDLPILRRPKVRVWKFKVQLSVADVDHKLKAPRSKMHARIQEHEQKKMASFNRIYLHIR